MQFAEACNGSDSVVARCADELLYDGPPCTDYAELSNAPMRLPLFPAAGDAAVPISLASSPVSLFRTAAGLPLVLTLAVLLLHASCW